MRLISSVKLTYARYKFLTERGIIVDINNSGKLFISGKNFSKQYGITKEDLLEMYKYEDYIKEKNDLSK